MESPPILATTITNSSLCRTTISENSSATASVREDKSYNSSLDLDLIEPRRDATEEELRTLPHVIDDIPLAVWIAAFVGAAERFTYYGITAPWRKLARVPFFTWMQR